MVRPVRSCRENAGAIPVGAREISFSRGNELRRTGPAGFHCRLSLSGVALACGIGLVDEAVVNCW